MSPDSFCQLETVRPKQTVLVFQGGGALGAYQAGVYEALSENGIEPDWVIGTSIGAINGAIIATNTVSDRLPRLREFWSRIEARQFLSIPFWGAANSFLANWSTLTQGVAGFFSPNPAAWVGGLHAPLGVKKAAFYNTDALRDTLSGLTGFADGTKVRLSLGAVNVRTSEMRYFDSSRDVLSVDHVMASGALPPAFPAITIENDPWWDGGIVSNTPIEAIFDDEHSKDSLVFAVNLWQGSGEEPKTIWQAASRQKDIQYNSRADGHIEDERKLLHLRKSLSRLSDVLTDEQKSLPEVREILAEAGCPTLHIARLFAPPLDGENHTKDIDFSSAGIEARWQAGYRDTLEMLQASPWQQPCDAREGIHVYTLDALRSAEQHRGGSEQQAS